MPTKRSTTPKKAHSTPKSAPNKIVFEAISLNISDSTTPHPHHRKVQFGLIVTMLIAAPLIVLSWLTTVRGSLSHFSVAGVSISADKNRSEMISALNKAFSNFRFTIVDEKNVSTTYSPSQVGVSIQPEKTIATILGAQNHASLLDKVSFWKQNTEPLVLSIDTAKLDQFVNTTLVKMIKNPVNATLESRNGTVVTTPDETGSAYTVSSARSTLLSTISYTNVQPLVLTKQVVPAPVTEAMVDRVATQATTISQLTVQLSLKGKQFTPSSETILSWIQPINAESTKAELTIDSGNIQNYLDSIAKPYVNLPMDQIVFTNPDGSERVVVPGKNGIDIISKTDIAKKIASQLKSKKGVNESMTIGDATFTSVPAQTYDKWIIVDLTAKRLDAYEKNTLVNSFPVSAGKSSTPTALGQFKIYYKTKVQDMRGLNLDGSTYLQPAVRWNSFFNGDMAIHGNYWVPSDGWFGVYNSSHGCVGAAESNSQWIYEWAPIGTPVITHY